MKKKFKAKDQQVLSIRNHHKHDKCLSQLFLLHLNTYAMGLQPLKIFQCGIDIRRQKGLRIDAICA